MSKKDLRASKNAIFSVKPIKNTNTAVIKCVAHIAKDDSITDEPIICNKITVTQESTDGDDNRYVYKITDSIYVRFFHCNIRDSFVLTTRTLPVMYASIMYRTNLICGLLFNIFVDFIIETEIKSEQQLINNTLTGKYQIRIKTNDTDPPKIIELDSYEKNIIEIIKSLIDTPEMKNVIAALMEERRKSRSEWAGSFDNIDIPKPKYNFTQLVREYRSTGKYSI